MNGKSAGAARAAGPGAPGKGPEAIRAEARRAARLLQQGRTDEAVNAYRRAMERHPASPLPRVGLAGILKRRGDIRGAYDLLLPLIGSENCRIAAVTEFAGVSNRLDPPPPEAIPLLRKHLARPGLRALGRIKILRGLGRLCDALGRCEEALACLNEVKALQSREFGSDSGQFFRMLDATARAYTPERLARLPRASHGSELPVFIVGMPRSATTLTEQILSSHPRVHGAGELTHIIRYARNLAEGQAYGPRLDALTPERVNALAADYLGRLRALAPGAARITDKMPFNFVHLGLIEILFPGARVIHCIRHPLDTCLSCYFNEFPDGLSITRDFATLGRYYRGYWELMEHWQKVLSIPVFPLRYEGLVAEPERQIRELVAFCGLEWDDACLRFYETGRLVHTSSYHQVHKPIYQGSVNRYRPYERFLGPLKAGLGDVPERAGYPLQQ
ncbi:MAG: sulfotransferase [Betaproteobacteria bacterium]|nr:sulfotransferase [Betaproteobacteria bacterium]